MSSNMQIPKRCLCCGKEFIAQTTVTKYCSHKCASKAYKINKRRQKIEIAKSNNQFSLHNPKTLSIDTTNLNSKEYLSVLETANLMGIDRSTVWRYCANNQLKCTRLNRKIYIRRKDIDMIFESAIGYKVKPTAPKPITGFYTLDEIVHKFGYSKRGIYRIIETNNIPTTIHLGKLQYSKKHIDQYFKKQGHDLSITEWYTIEEIMEKYAMTKTAVYCFVSDNSIPRTKLKGKSSYSKKHCDNLLKDRAKELKEEEWYSMEDIKNKYGLEAKYVANFVFRNKIARMRKGHLAFYSKKQFDECMQAKLPPPEYYTMEQAMKKFKLNRDALYRIVKLKNIPKVKDGKHIKISKPELDKVFEKPIINYY